MSVRAVITKVVKHGRQVLLQGVGRKKATKTGLFKSEGHAETGSTPACLVSRNSALQQKVQTGQSLIARNLQSCTFRSLAAELRRQAAIRLSGNLYGRAVELSQLSRSRLPIYAFVALGFAAHQNKDDEPDFNAITENIKAIFEAKTPSTPKENLQPADTEQNLSSYDLGPMVGIGCNAAVHLARKVSDATTPVIEEETASTSEMDTEDRNGSIEEEQRNNTNYDLAIKMMFNYNIESDAGAICREMQNELIPAQDQEGLGDMEIWQNGNHVRKKRLKPHPNIVDMQTAFVDKTPALPEGSTEYPLALPPTLYEGGLGRNKTLFAVMKRYDMTLHDYVGIHNVGWFEGTCLLTQLVEAIVHLNQAGIAHRDIKSNNVLVTLNDNQVPDLVLSDFGSCFDDPDYNLTIPYQTDQINRGGNPCLMAPEISSMHPGPYSVLDYRKADLWAVGAIAYEIFGGRNPFYGDNDNTLHSYNYKEDNLPPLPDCVPSFVKTVVKLMLKRDPTKRPSASQIADMLHFVLWSPQDWLTQNGPPDKVKVMHWLLVLTTEVMMERSFHGSQRSTCQLKETFLTRLVFQELISSMEHLYSQM